MSLVIDSECLMCQFHRNLDTVKPLGTEEQTMAFAKDLMRMYLDAPEGVAAPWFNPLVADLMHEHYGLPIDRMKEEKILSNRFVMERMDLLRETAQSAPDPMFAGLQLAILGNYLDFAALGHQVSFEKLEEMIRDALKMELDQDTYASFCSELEQGKRLLYLTDNAGEIGMDRIFAEAIAQRYPHLEITFCVRGEVIINDATREDAAAVGIPFPIIDNGNRIPGTQIDMLSEEAKQALDNADVILAKGMANCETMHGCGYNVYYAFLVKCKKFVNIFGKPLMTPMFVKERR